MRTENRGGMPPLSCSPVLMPMPCMKMAGQGVARVVHRCEDAKENQKLDLSECQLMHVPDGVYHLMRNTVVLYCNISANVIRKIPPKFVVNFSNVTELNLSNNQIHTLPEEMVDIKDLSRIDISHNQFHSLPKVLLKMPKLKYINAEKNYIADVDVARLNSSQLTQAPIGELNLSENPLMKSCHDQLKNLTRITIHMTEYHDDLIDFDDLDDLEPE